MGYAAGISGRFDDDVAEARQLELKADIEALIAKYGGEWSMYLDLQSEPELSSIPPADDVHPDNPGAPPPYGQRHAAGSYNG